MADEKAKEKGEKPLDKLAWASLIISSLSLLVSILIYFLGKDITNTLKAERQRVMRVLDDVAKTNNENQKNIAVLKESKTLAQAKESSESIAQSQIKLNTKIDGLRKFLEIYLDVKD